MASVSQGAVTRRAPSFAGRNGLVDRYFYFAMSLLIAVIVVCGFSLTIDQSLFHAAIPRPLLLWIHGAAFSAWVAFYILQSALVRTHNACPQINHPTGRIQLHRVRIEGVRRAGVARI